ncbi:CHAP domain-containing protein [Streptococcus agalactiae]|uniref:CHAP domain-containing protein n=1 Tax=Streptococcus agalactiae TaxID=1311 RepID=UPI00178C73BA|nr:CHAP domain-containing protein [Streptococcus agalactiae]
MEENMNIKQLKSKTMLGTVALVSAFSFASTNADANTYNYAVDVDYLARAEEIAQAHPASNTFPLGQCTWGVKEMATWAGNWWGNGGDWAASAASAGYTVGTQPRVGSIVCWTDGSYGHVAYVTAVDPVTNKIQVLESNYAGHQWIDNYRGWFDPQNTVTPGVVSYIYPN